MLEASRATGPMYRGCGESSVGNVERRVDSYAMGNHTSQKLGREVGSGKSWWFTSSIIPAPFCRKRIFESRVKRFPTEMALAQSSAAYVERLGIRVHMLHS